MFLSESEIQVRSEGKGKKTQFCFILAQLHAVSFFENLKEVYNIFCLSKCHSWKFREIILSSNRPKENSVFTVHDTKGLKLLTRPRLLLLSIYFKLTNLQIIPYKNIQYKMAKQRGFSTSTILINRGIKR